MSVNLTIVNGKRDAVGVFFAGVGEEKKVGLILKFKAHISKYVHCCFEGLKVLVYRLFGSSHLGVLGFNILRLLIVETSIIRVLCTTTFMLCIHLIFLRPWGERGLREQRSLS